MLKLVVKNAKKDWFSVMSTVNYDVSNVIEYLVSLKHPM